MTKYRGEIRGSTVTIERVPDIFENMGCLAVVLGVAFVFSGCGSAVLPAYALYLYAANGKQWSEVGLIPKALAMVSAATAVVVSFLLMTTYNTAGDILVIVVMWLILAGIWWAAYSAGSNKHQH
jgi:cytochrome c biogenesis protein CcdA